LIFGWDISTSIIGVTTLTDTGAFRESVFLDLRKIDTDLIEKSHEAECFIEHTAKMNPWASVHFVEDRLSNFASGKTMLQTLMKLAAFNATCSYLIHQKFRDHEGGTTVKHLHPSTVKGIMRKQGLVIPKGADKKVLTLEWVSQREPQFPVTLNKNGNPQPYCFDMSDSYIVAKAGYLQGCSKSVK
jgi:hypothetical protein